MQISFYAKSKHYLLMKLFITKSLVIKGLVVYVVISDYKTWLKHFIFLIKKCVNNLKNKVNYSF